MNSSGFAQKTDACDNTGQYLAAGCFRFFHFMHFIRVIVLLFAGYLVTLSSQPQASTAWLDQFWLDTQRKLNERDIPGFSLVLVQPDRDPIFINLGKTHKQGNPVDEQTLYRLASVSKTFTGGLTAKLVSQGKLQWHQPLAELAPEIKFTQNNREITLHHLLTQSSGLMPNAYDNLIEANYSLPRILNELGELEPLCPPGECYTYQNALFGVLEHHFNKQDLSYAAVLEQEILSPLNMQNTSVGKEALEASLNWARPHVFNRKKKWVKTRISPTYYRVSPAAGVNTNAHDMAIWLDAMLGQYPNVLAPELINEIITPQTRTKRELRRRAWRKLLDNAHYGLGWRVYDMDGLNIAYHSGWVRGYRAEASFSPSTGVGIAMLMNAEANLMNELGADFWSAYMGQFQQAGASK